MIPDSSVSIVTGCGLDVQSSVPGSITFFLSPPGLGHIHFKWVLLLAPPPLPEREVDHSLGSGAEVKNVRKYTSTPLFVFRRCT
jgi:hypothetical protein